MGVSWTLWNPFRHVICARSARWFIFGGQAAGPQGRCSFPCGLPRNRPSTRSRRRPVRPRSCKGRTRTAGRGTVRSVPRRLMSAIFPLPEAGSAVLRSPTAPRASRLQAALRSLRTGSMRRIVSAPAEGKTRDAAAAFPIAGRGKAKTCIGWSLFVIETGWRTCGKSRSVRQDRSHPPEAAASAGSDSGPEGASPLPAELWRAGCRLPERQRPRFRSATPAERADTRSGWPCPCPFSVRRRTSWCREPISWDCRGIQRFC